MAGERRELRRASMARPGGHDSHAAGGAGLVFVVGQLPIAAGSIMPSSGCRQRGRWPDNMRRVA